MESKERVYIAIDLKSFFASVECKERGTDPLTTNLVVADESRTEKTICLAVSPSLKQYGIPGRARLFEVVQKVQRVNQERLSKTTNGQFTGCSVSDVEIKKDPNLQVSYIVAQPRMSYYIQYSTTIYNIYLKYVSSEDIHAYSIDEVFMDVTDYLHLYQLSPRELAMKMIRDVLKTTGITATAGIGTNLYLCKIAMDIVAKKMPADADGVRIAELDEMGYRKMLWNHQPITDFWRVGRGYQSKLKSVGIFTMGDIARCSIGKPNDYYNEDLLYKLFGVNAELLIDHAWGWEPCTMKDIKSYRPENNSLSNGQVLQEPYPYEKTRVVVWEMTDQLVLALVEKKLMTDQLVLTVGYDKESLSRPEIKKKYHGEISKDGYGREIPKHAHGTANLKEYSSSTKQITDAVMELYDHIVHPDLLARRITIAAMHVLDEKEAKSTQQYTQMNLFTDYQVSESDEKTKSKEQQMQQAILDIKKKFGKNAILKGTNLTEGATAMERNKQIGGHKA